MRDYPKEITLFIQLGSFPEKVTFCAHVKGIPLFCTLLKILLFLLSRRFIYFCPTKKNAVCAHFAFFNILSYGAFFTYSIFFFVKQLCYIYIYF